MSFLDEFPDDVRLGRKIIPSTTQIIKLFKDFMFKHDLQCSLTSAPRWLFRRFLCGHLCNRFDHHDRTMPYRDMIINLLLTAMMMRIIMIVLIDYQRATPSAPRRA